MERVPNYGDNGPFNTIPEQNTDYAGGRGEQSGQDPSTSKNRSKKRKPESPNTEQTDWESGQGPRKRKVPEVYQQNFVKAEEEESTEDNLRPKARIKPKLLGARGVEQSDPRAKGVPNYGDNGPYNPIPEQNTDYAGGRGEQSRQDPSTSKNRSKKRKTESPNTEQTDWESGQGPQKRKVPEVYQQNFVKAKEEEESTEDILRPKARIKPKLLEARRVEQCDPRAKRVPNYGDNGPYNPISEQNTDYAGGRGEQSRQDPSTSENRSKKRKTESPNTEQIDWESGQGPRKRKVPEVYQQNFVKAKEEEESTEDILRPKARIKPKLLEARGVEQWDPRAKDLMLKTGYVPGKGLGSKATGIENPVDAGRENDGRGLGFQRKYEQENTDWTFEEEQTVEKEVKWILKDNPLDIHTIVSGMVEGEKKEIIDDEINFCRAPVLREILRLKTLLDDMKPRELLEARTRSNPYERIKKGIFINRAAMKMANIDSILDFEITKLDTSDTINDDLLYFADVCAGPGGFTEYVLYRKKWLAKGFGFTLKGDCDFKLRTFKVASTETFEAIYGPEANSDGDVYNPDNVQYFVNYVQKNTGGLGVHFMMADGGFSVEGKENIQEILSHQIYLSQCLIALSIVRTGGHFICKFFDIFTPFSVGLIYLFRLCFERVSVHKPVTSRPANSERYLYCMNKLNSRDVDTILEYLKRCHNRMWELKSISTVEGRERTVTELVDLEILKNKSSNFFHYICESNNEFGKDQIEGLKKIIAFHKNQDLKETRQWETRTKFMNAWRVEMVPIDVGDLLEENIIEGLIKSPDTLLTAGNLKPFVKSPYFWMCTPIECPETKFYRAFYKSNGRSSISKYEGGYRKKWSSLGENFVSFEMPRNTLVYGEIVFGKQNRAAFYIIDGYMLGGINIQNENFVTRIKMCEKFALAVNKERNDKGNPLACVKVKSFTKLGKEYFPEFISKLKYLPDAKSDGVYCPLNLEAESPLYLASGLLFLKITKEPWIKHWSRSQKREYYYHTLSKQSFYDVPIDADADFSYTISNRLVWYWNRRLLEDTGTNSTQQLTYHSLFEYLKSL